MESKVVAEFFSSQTNIEIMVSGIGYLICIVVCNQILGRGKLILLGIILAQLLASIDYINLTLATLNILIAWSVGILCSKFAKLKISNSAAYCVGILAQILISTLFNNLRIISYTAPFMAVMTGISLIILKDYRDTVWKEVKHLINIIVSKEKRMPIKDSIIFGLLFFTIYVLYLGLLQATPDAYDSYTVYLEQLRNTEAFGTTRQISEWIRAQDWRPNGSISLMGSLYPWSNILGIRITLLACTIGATNLIVQTLSKYFNPANNYKYVYLLSNIYVLTTAIIYLSIAELYMEAIVYMSFSTLAWLLSIYWNKRNAALRESRFNIFTGVIIGTALIVKLYLVFYVSAFFAILIAKSLSNTHDIKGSVSQTVKVGIIAIATGSWPYLLTYIETENPFFPFYNGVFKSKDWWPVNFDNQLYSTKLSFSWLLDIVTDTRGKYMEATFGYISIASGILVIISTVFVINQLRCVIDKNMIRRVNWGAITLYMFAIVPSIFIVNNQNYTRYIAHMILFLGIFGIIFLEQKSRKSKNKYEFLLASIIRGCTYLLVICQIFTAKAAVFGSQRNPANWQINYVGLPELKNENTNKISSEEVRLLNAWKWKDKKFSEYINKTYRINNKKSKKIPRVVELIDSHNQPVFTGYGSIIEIEILNNKWLTPFVTDCYNELKSIHPISPELQLAKLLSADYLMISEESFKEIKESELYAKMARTNIVEYNLIDERVILNMNSFTSHYEQEYSSKKLFNSKNSRCLTHLNRRRNHNR